MRTHGSIERRIRRKIDFLKWARLGPKTMAAMDVYESPDIPVYVSPDVLSLHISWIIDGEVSHEIADFPSDDDGFGSIVKWLQTEVFDDAWDTFEYDSREDIWDGQEIEDIPIVEFVSNAKLWVFRDSEQEQTE